MAILFATTAAVVIWQNSRLAVLWDLSYVLENAHRISLGDVPYRDFPFPYPPLTFLIQAAIIKLSGHVFWHHVVYCALAGGVGSVLTWRILFNVLRPAVGRAHLIAFILTLPLTVLGIYCIFPHPFYDPDCTLIVLLAIFLLQRAEVRPSSFVRTACAGAVVAVPLFIKQNTGLAFLISVVIGLLVLMIHERWHKRNAARLAFSLLGVAVSLAIALGLIGIIAGWSNYWHWTIKFAAARRTPALAEMFAIYTEKAEAIWLALFVLGLTAALYRKRSKWISSAAVGVMSIPFAWPTIYLWLDHDPSERAERLLGLWPFVMIASLVLSIITIRKRSGLSVVLPFVLVATVNGAFMSQQLWGSTYAVWPLFVILVAEIIASLSILMKDRRWPPLFLTAIICLSLSITGGFYVWSHERLDYANLDDGALTRSNLPRLKGMSTRGDWLPNFEELVQYTEREIPREDGILTLPGEDLFYYTTGRRPQFPVLLFDHTVNPYSKDEILKLARDRNIRWLIVKQDLQDEDEELEKQRDELTEALEEDFEQVTSLKNYDVYKRNEPDESLDK